MILPPWVEGWIPTGAITAITATIVWYLSPGQRKKDDAAARATDASQAEVLVASALRLLEEVREQRDAMVAELSEQVTALRAEVAALKAEIHELRTL